MGNSFGAQRIEGTRWLGWLDAAAWGPTPAFSLEAVSYTHLTLPTILLV